jgi:hypothetical protein
MTKTGHTHARRALGEGAWASRSPATGRRHLHLRLAKLPTALPALRGKAHVRLCTRYRHLRTTGPQAHQVVVAMARALRAFLWAIAQPMAVTPQAESRLLVAATALQGFPVSRQRRRPGVVSPSAAL